MLDDTPTAAVEKSPNPHRGRPGLKSRKPEPYLADDLDQEGKLDFHAGPPCKTSDAHNDPDDDAEFFLVRGSDQSDD
ncbi:MAG: hypothetical protein NTY19_42790 [Planctomycetota bacterium]|nr:hypothetical protein [Planctomycetota bacterium]